MLASFLPELKAESGLTSSLGIAQRFPRAGPGESFDAMGCQKEIAKKIVSKGGDYLLGLKGNQAYLEQRTTDFFDSLPDKPRDTSSFTVSTFKTEGVGYGRQEKRQCIAVVQKEGKSLGVNVLNKWPSLNTLIRVNSEVKNKKTGNVSEYTRHYISSFSF